MGKLSAALSAIVGEQGVLRNEPMSDHTTFRVGGPAEFFVEPATVEELCDVVALCRAEDAEWRIMGHGSNVLVADAGLRGVTVHVSGNLGEVEVREDGVVVAQAGASNAKVASAALRSCLTGYEFAAGIPGTVGGAAIMNAGAYDGEFRQVAISVRCLTSEGEVVDVPAEQAGWGYRTSALMQDGSIVLDATLKLQAGDEREIRARMDDLARRRQEKQPIELPSAGSTFKRPPGLFAGKLIQDAGMQGYTVGGAQVSTKHAGFVVNVGSASAADVLAVIRDVQDRVLDSFGVQLEPEVRLWGFE